MGGWVHSPWLLNYKLRGGLFPALTATQWSQITRTQMSDCQAGPLAHGGYYLIFILAPQIKYLHPPDDLSTIYPRAGFIWLPAFWNNRTVPDVESVESLLWIGLFVIQIESMMRMLFKQQWPGVVMWLVSYHIEANLSGGRRSVQQDICGPILKPELSSRAPQP